MSGRSLRATFGAILTMAVLCGGIGQATGDPIAATHSAAAFYNAGNAQARSGHAALAVLEYERARLLAPDDPDIAANLRHVRESVGLPPQAGSWLQAHDRFASPDTMYWLGLLGLLCAGISLVILRAQRQQTRQTYRAPLKTVAILGGLLTLLSVGDALATDSMLHEYVVLDPSPATGSPVSNGAPMFIVSPADGVQGRHQYADFLLVTDSRGRQGWVARSHLEAVVPPSGAALHGD